MVLLVAADIFWFTSVARMLDAELRQEYLKSLMRKYISRLSWTFPLLKTHLKRMSVRMILISIT